jgi:Txe/YoeB family toxin of toxin-antitoxin system
LLERSGLDKKAKKLLSIMKNDPFQNPPPYEKLAGNMAGAYSRRINIHNRLVYQVAENNEQLKEKNGDLYQGIVRVLRMWTHYE